MLTEVGSALGGAAGLAALLSPLLVHLSQRRTSTQVERAELVDDLQHERDVAVERADTAQRQAEMLWTAYLDLRYWLVKGAQGDPPTLPPGLTVGAVRARMGAPT